MKTFKDCESRDWVVAVNVDSIKRVRALLNGTDLLSVLDEKGTLLRDLHTNPVLVVDVVYCLCKPQADERGISDEQFGQAMAGDVIDRASRALMEDLVDFFPEARRSILKKILQKVTQLEEKIAARAEKILDGPELDRLMEKVLNDSSGTSPDSSE